ncbi:hypothetical protein V9J60_003426 [Vibrio cholerae]|uniref:Uncharacterized protein n=1 Tax=Vibrio cidicii TaxID=1763883 RepID=A0A151JG15_9VIBR|nr:hypothetical protein [Vibrio cidicii]EIK2269796.1 hypothetical protein [Vibrio cholerae]EKF9477991.1 hypothetical protein [Vibrio cholerae]ELD6124609.1 hypothetical protein [Vibrio cholerae]KYN24720.1 hypothetical protein AUQ44_02205 [Vibrio cidicii]
MEKRSLADGLFRFVETMNKYKSEVLLTAESFLSDKQSADEINIEWGNGDLVFMYLNGVSSPVLVLENVDDTIVCKELSNVLEVLEIYYDTPKEELLSSNIKFAFLAKDDLLKLQHSAEEVIMYFSPFLNSRPNQDYLVFNGKKNKAWRESWRQNYC